MNWFRKLIAALFGFDSIIDNLKNLNKIYENESKKIVYCHIEQPTVDKIEEFNKEVGSLADSKHFSFMLDAMEGFLINDLRSAKQNDIATTSLRINGALQMIECIRKTVVNANTPPKNEESDESDIILNNMSNMFNASMN